MNDDELDQLSDFDEIDDLEEESQEENEWVEDPYEESDDYTSDAENESEMIEDLLQQRGISDPYNIKFEGSDGIIRNRSWNDLTYEEQRNILNQNPDSDPERDLDDDEIDLINDVRRSGLTPDEYTESLLDYQKEPDFNEEPTYAVDDLTDDELFILDLQSKSDDITDDEAIQALLMAKYNEDLFAKQMSGLRTEYKQLEEDRNNQLSELQRAEEENQFNEFAQSISDEIYNLNNVGTLDVNLDQEDQEELAEFILGKDEAGVSYLGKALNDPETLTRMAWFALYGEDTFNEINSYMSNQIRAAAQQGYNKGFYEGRNGGSRVVIRPTGGDYGNNNYESSYDELDDLD